MIYIRLIFQSLDRKGAPVTRFLVDFHRRTTQNGPVRYIIISRVAFDHDITYSPGKLVIIRQESQNERYSAMNLYKALL